MKTDGLIQWTTAFPDEYYRELFRLRGVPYPDGPPKPGYIGRWTNDIIFERLPSDVIKILTENTAQKNNWKYGHPKLKEHLSNVIVLMKSCSTWVDFKRRINRACPKIED